MPAATLGSVSLSADPNYASTGAWVESFDVGPPVYLKAFPDAAGVDGTGVKRYGFRSRRVVVNAIYVAGSEATAVSTPNTDLASLTNSAFSATVAGISMPQCELDSENCAIGPEVRPTGFGNFWCKARFAFVQTGLT